MSLLSGRENADGISPKRARRSVAVRRAFSPPATRRSSTRCVRGLEKKGVLAVAIFDLAEDYVHGDYEEQMLEFHPLVVVHTCHSTDSLAFRERLGVPHLHSIFFRTQSIAIDGSVWRSADQ